jgi:hypothetical protein
MTKLNKKCVICRQTFDGIGANAHPVSLYGTCCNDCDIEKVIPARILEREYQKLYGDELGSLCIRGLIHLNMKAERTVELYKNRTIT